MYLQGNDICRKIPTLVFRTEIPTKLLAQSVPLRLVVLAKEDRIPIDEALVLLAFLLGKRIWEFFEDLDIHNVTSDTLRDITPHVYPWYETFSTIPSPIQKILLDNFENFKSFWKYYEKDILNILCSIHGSGPTDTINVYPIPAFFGITSSLLPKNNAILLGIPLVQKLGRKHLLELTKVLVHELAHLYFLFSEQARHWSVIYFGNRKGTEEHAKRVTKYVMTKILYLAKPQSSID